MSWLRRKKARPNTAVPTPMRRHNATAVVWAAGCLAIAIAPLAAAWAKPIYSEDFESCAEGPVAAKVVRDNTWTGDKTGYRIVDTHTKAGKVLEVNVTTFAQMVLGRPVKVMAGTKYRILSPPRLHGKA